MSQGHADHSALAHHFDDLEQQHEAATLGMWAFLATEVLFFGGLFVTYVFYRMRYPEAFAAAGGELDVVAGTINTGFLLGSSLTVAFAVRAAQLGQRKALMMLLGATILLGAIFLGVKGFEYASKFEHHLVPGAGFHFEGYEGHGPELFFGLYFAMTGLHATHMVIGLGIFCFLLFRVWRGRYLKDHSNPIEMAGLYWHFVDIVWIYLFPLLYLIG